ncbi:hypothetical protein KXV95_004572 [Aspergillus fumigatus]|nr:hypothetical protein KXX36_006619 [Aspergillus fumigatus]KAH3577988.1 hypothetical protein KXV95_004572 [Aspergillus fumigatus]
MASIIPSLSRHDGSEEALKRFKKVLKSTEELPSVIHEASVVMGIRGYSDSDDSLAFTADVLRIEVVGDTGLCLTIVDLPGLISVSDYDEGEADVQLVNTLIDSYLTLLQQTRDSLLDLGDERSSVLEQRKYLLKISMDYLNLIQAVLNGRYQEVEPTFFGNASSKPSFNRLRARIHELNTNFATYIRDKGQKRKVAGDREPGMEDFSADQTSISCRDAFPEPLRISEQKFKIWVLMKTFVDNICRQVLERHILRPLQSTFYLTEVGVFSDRDIRRIASESSKIAQKRQELKNRAEALERSLVLLSESTDALFDME